MKQGSLEWQTARLGIPTASRFDSILTRKTMKPSASQTRYLCELVAERMLGCPVDDVGTSAMQRGSELEQKAVEEYELETGHTCEAVGFCLEDGKRWGCSPDRLIGEYGLLEVKCLNAPNHIAALLGYVHDDHFAQCQGQMMVTGRAWADLKFYNPSMPSATVRVDRDPDYIRVLRDALEVFVQRLDEDTRRLGIEWRGASGLTQGTEARRAG
jgi:exodeoxyribonuclease (lambda-induced)